LVEGTVGGDGGHPSLFGGVSGHDVSGGERAGLAASPDESSDVPGEARAVP